MDVVEATFDVVGVVIVVVVVVGGETVVELALFLVLFNDCDLSNSFILELKVVRNDSAY